MLEKKQKQQIGHRRFADNDLSGKKKIKRKMKATSLSFPSVNLIYVKIAHTEKY